MNTRQHSLPPGEGLGLHLAAGAEIFCPNGVLRLRTAAGTTLLFAGQGWRAGEAAYVGIEALAASRCRIVQAPPVPARASPMKRFIAMIAASFSGSPPWPASRISTSPTPARTTAGCSASARR